MFCSPLCRDAFRRSRTGKAHPLYRSIQLTCPLCSAAFEVTPRRLKRGCAVYCSMACGREGRRRTLAAKPRTGIGEPSGKLGAKKRDKYACRICGFSLAVHGHHIIPKKLGGTNDLDNIVTLCPNHHALAHAGILTESEMRVALAGQPEWLLGAPDIVRPKGVLNKGFYRVDLTRN